MTRRSILVVTENFPNRHTPFLGTYVATTLRALAERHRVVALIPTHVPLVRSAATDAADPVVPGVVVVRMSRYSLPLRGLMRAGLLSRDMFFHLAKRRLRSALIERAHALHGMYRFDLVHGQEVLVGDEAVPVARALGLRSLVTIHGLAPYHAEFVGSRAMAAIVRNLREADALSTVSESARRSYREAGVDHPRFEVIANAVGPLSSAMLPSPWRDRLQGKRVILYVGFLVPAKRPAALIDLACVLRGDANLRDVVMVLVGSGPQEPELRGRVESAGLSDVVLFAGARPPDEMGAWYAASSLVVHPSVSEAFSTVCLEAATAGRPIVCTEAAAPPGLAAAGAGVVVPTDNGETLAQEVRSLMGDAARRRTMGDAGRRFASAFTVEAQVAAFEALYDSMLA